MGVAGRFAGHRAQAEPLILIETGRFQPAVVEDQRLVFGIFHKQLAVVGALDGVGDQTLDSCFGDIEFFQQWGGHAQAPLGGFVSASSPI
jgi:hypothetical protein